MTNDSQVIKAYYTSMLQLEQTAGRASLIGTVITGVILSLFTKWGLFKFYWIITKEILSLICLAIGFIFIFYWTINGIQLSEESIGDHFIANHYQLMIWIIIQVVLLAILFILSVFKPWGKRQ
jgi:general stress protein CsbA